MLGKDISFESPEENILYDELLLQLAEEGKLPETLRFWESPITFVVLGRISKAADDLNIASIKKDRIKVLRRASGGGTVLQGKGSLNYTLILSKETPPMRDLKRSYAFILGRMVEALKALSIAAAYYPISDIAFTDGQRKFSGNAQKRGRQFIMHHGTLLIDFDLSLIEKYLAMPKDIPDYRKGRSHQDFVSNLNVERRQIKIAIKKAFGVQKEAHELNDLERSRLSDLLRTKDIGVPIDTLFSNNIME